MAMGLGPLDPRSPELNKVTVMGVASPGVARLSGVGAPYKWTINEPYGMTGASTVFQGRAIAHFTLTIQLITAEDFLAWPVFMKLLEPPSRRKPFFVDMNHPVLATAGIASVSVEELGQPERQSNGAWIATIKLIEFRPPRPALIKPKGSVPDVEAKPQIAPKTAADIALDKAAADAQAAYLRGHH